MPEPDKILVVDDTPAHLTILFNRLTQYGYQVLIASTGEQAIIQAQHGEPDLILLDVMMPGLDGFETCHHIKDIPQLADVPVIFMTSLTDSDSKIKAFAVGGVDYVTKPLDYKEVLVRIQTHVTMRQLQKDLIAKNKQLIEEITERKQIELALRESEERYALAAQGANDGLWDWNLDNHQVYYSPRWKTMLGYGDTEVKNHLLAWFSRVHPLDFPQLQRQLIAHLQQQSGSFECEYRILHRNGTYQWVLCRGVAVRDENGKSYRMAGSQTDITDRKAVEQRLLHEASHDSLTGLPNRSAMMDKLHQLLEGQKQTSIPPFAMLFLDMDNFKLINDTFGHLTGDKVLIAVTERIKRCVRPHDMVARLGGDEFTVLLEDIASPDHTENIVNRIQRALGHPIIINNEEIFVTVSIGIAINSNRYHQAEELLRDADKAMYQAKSSGRGNHKLFDINHHRHSTQRRHLEKELRQAVLGKNLTIAYQPIFALTTALPHQRVAKPDMVGVVATVNLSNSQLEILTANNFRPIIDDIGLSHYLDSWLLAKAGQQIAVWRASGYQNLWLLLHVSLMSIQKPMFIEQLKRLLGETNLPPQALCLGITSNPNVQDGHQYIKQLTNIGVQLLLDQFGQRQSSLMQLKTWPVQQLKIASPLLDGLGKNKADETLAQTIINLGHAFNINVMADSVRNAEQFNFLCTHHCHYAYGPWFGQPVMAHLFDKLYAAY